MAIDFYGLALDAYGLSVRKCTGTRDGQLLEASDGNKYILRTSRIRPEKIICAHIAIQHLRNNGFKKAVPYLLSTGGLPFAFCAGNYYTLSPAVKNRECVLEDNGDLTLASAILAEMHNCADGFTGEKAENEVQKYLALMPDKYEAVKNVPSEEPPAWDPEKPAPENNDETVKYFKCELGQTADTFTKRLAELKKFRRMAKKRCDKFDYAYLAVADYYCSLAEHVCEGMANSSYQSVTDYYRKTGCLCHRDFTAHNILMPPGGTADGTGGNTGSIFEGSDPQGFAVLGFDNVCIEIPVYDLANFIRRRMRKSGWSPQDAELIVKEYDRVKPVSPEEIEILKLLLQFPQKLWRIVNKYYNSRKVWCEKSCLSKLAEVENERLPLAEFTKHFLV